MPTLPDPQALQDAVYDSFEHHCKPYREKRTATLAEIAGAHFGTGDSKQRITNLLAQYIEIMEPTLSGHTPGCEVAPRRRPDLRFEADLLKLQLEMLAERHGDAELISDAVLDALTGPFAIVHSGMRGNVDQAVVDEREKSLGESFEEVIDLDDFFWDPRATKDGNQRYEGHFFEVDREVAIACGAFGRDPGDYEPGEFEALYGSEQAQTGDQSDDQEEGAEPAPATKPSVKIATRAEAVEILKGLGKASEEAGTEDANSTQQLGNPAKSGDAQDGVGDQIKLIQVALYIGGACWRAILPAAKGKAGKYLVCEPWMGPTMDVNGPYDKLRLRKLPKHIPGIPMVALITDLHDAANVVSNKIVEQTKNLKVNWVVRPGEETLAEAVEQAADRQFVVGDPTAITALQSNVLIKDLFTGQEFIAGEWASHSGNAPLLAGMESDATDGTATAATYLQENSQLKTNKKRGLVAALAQKLLRRRAWGIISDPIKSTVLPWRDPAGETQEVVYSAETRRGSYQDFTYTIRPMSVPTNDPIIRTQRDVQMLAAAQPLLETIMALGGDVHAFLRQLGRRISWDDMDEWLPDQAQLMYDQALAVSGPQNPRQPQGQPQAGPGQPASPQTPQPPGQPTPGRSGPRGKGPPARAAAGAAR